MCGRYTLTAKEEDLARKFLLKYMEEELKKSFQPRYNIAPSQPVMAIRNSHNTGERKIDIYLWGLVPFWAKDTNIGFKMINARSETAATNGAFRGAFKYRRCLIPASGFYEWERVGKIKQPWYFTAQSEEPLAMAGLHERWQSADGSVLETCTILTTEPNAVMAPIHNRMPVILNPEDWDLWLDTEVQDARRLQPLMRPCANERIKRYPVSTRVNSPRNEGRELLEEIDPATGDFKNQQTLFDGLL